MALRRFFTAICMAVGLIGCGGGDAPACEVCVRTEAGRVMGAREGEVLAFKSIPYAAAPIGPLRFRPPQPAAPWEGVRDATYFREACPQLRDPIEVYPRPATTVFNPLTRAYTEVFENEDCLHVSVWTPAVDGRKRPVMVFIPGGAFVVGNGSNDFYTGQHLAGRDVVVMTINYRVGLFGFMELGSIDPLYAGSGNNGLRDQIAALKWARRNAQAFGGDPDNITVFGESAGAISISALLATRTPEQLFRRAIAQSGGPNLVHTAGFAQAAAAAIRQWGPSKSMADFLGATTRELLEQQESALFNVAGGDQLFAPYVDGSLILGSPYDLIASGNARGVDLMLGANQDELGYWSLYDSQLRNPFVEQTDLGAPSTVISKPVRDFVDANLAPQSLDAVYRQWVAMNETPTGQRTLARTVELVENHDYVMIQPMTRLAERQAANNPRTWLYRFQWAVPSRGSSSDPVRLGAVHALELPFVFGTLSFAGVPVPGVEAALADPFQLQQARSLSDSMVTAWTEFARTGDPNGAGVPPWRAYETTRRPTMLWRSDATGAITSASVDDPDSERRMAWASWPFPLNSGPEPVQINKTGASLPGHEGRRQSTKRMTRPEADTEGIPK